MSADEVAMFERMPYFKTAIRLRRIDDLAKDADAKTPPFTHFLAQIDQALICRSGSWR
jgi:predicted HD phosphohydrolase